MLRDFKSALAASEGSDSPNPLFSWQDSDVSFFFSSFYVTVTIFDESTVFCGCFNGLYWWFWFLASECTCSTLKVQGVDSRFTIFALSCLISDLPRNHLAWFLDRYIWLSGTTVYALDSLPGGFDSRPHIRFPVVHIWLWELKHWFLISARTPPISTSDLWLVDDLIWFLAKWN